MNILQNNETFFRKEMEVPLQKKSVRRLHHPDRINNKFPVAELYSKFRESRSNYKMIKRVVNSLLLSNLNQRNLKI
jgi:hypothetical protein